MTGKAQEPDARGAIQIISPKQLVQYLGKPIAELQLRVFEMTIPKRIR